MTKAISTVISSDRNFVLAVNKNGRIQKGANVFYFFRNQYNQKGDIKNNIFDEIEEIEKNGLQFVNCILCPLANSTKRFADNVLYIMWFTNDIKKYQVYKDNIREKSIWKDVEWGKREKNYNKKGKDPGNVWIPTDDDGKGNITKHNILSLKEIVERIVKFSVSKSDSAIINLHESIEVDGYDLIQEQSDSVLSLDPHVYDYLSVPDCNSKSELTSDVFFDTSEVMPQINDLSLSCMVTSPPYWDIKNYYKKGQIGQESYETYQKRITNVWKATADKTSEYGSIWINVNTIFKNKKLIPIPNDIIKNCKKIGLHLKACIIWHKSSAIPTHALNLCDHFEYVFVFTKTDKWYLNYPGVINDYFNDGLLNGSFWNINRKAGIIGKNYIHPAVFPLELIERIISLSTNKKDLTLDPFLGSGTSLIASLNLDRSFVGYEFYEGFKNLIEYRIQNECKYKSITSYHLKTNESGVETKIFRKE